ncbi:hypothetical protein MKX03_032882 [Papaver bracteatum]|nr:hypothetical protein MKX03_032882 [Papaver bracteatum]
MDTFTMFLIFSTSFITTIVSYTIWFNLIKRSLKGPRVWPLLGSLPGLIENHDCLHDWITENLRKCGGTCQTCICAVPFLARKQGLITVGYFEYGIESICLESRFENYPKGPTWKSVFHDLLGEGIFNSDGDTWLFQRKTAALEFTTRTLRQAMARWLNQIIKFGLCPILKTAQLECKPVDLQDLLFRLTFDNICGLIVGRDPQTLSVGLPENWFATAFDRATEATLQRFVLPKVVWQLRKWLRLGMEVTLSQSLDHIDEYLSNVIKARKMELLSKPGSGATAQHDDLLSRFMKKKESYSDWFFWLCIQNPRVEEKILNEICTVLIETRGNDTTKWMDERLGFEENDHPNWDWIFFQYQRLIGFSYTTLRNKFNHYRPIGTSACRTAFGQGQLKSETVHSYLGRFIYKVPNSKFG